MRQHRALILRSNRFLGASLVDKGLVSSSDLEAANEKFMSMIQDSELSMNSSILMTLIHELKALDENDLLEQTVEEHSLGLIDLSFVDLPPISQMNVDLDMCRATSTIPFDKVDDCYLVATCYYLSAPVIKYWEEHYKGKIVWYGTSTLSLTRADERLVDLAEAESQAAIEAAEEAEAELKAASDAKQ